MVVDLLTFLFFLLMKLLANHPSNKPTIRAPIVPATIPPIANPFFIVFARIPPVLTLISPELRVFDRV